MEEMEEMKSSIKLKYLLKNDSIESIDNIDSNVQFGNIDNKINLVKKPSQ